MLKEFCRCHDEHGGLGYPVRSPRTEAAGLTFCLRHCKFVAAMQDYDLKLPLINMILIIFIKTI